MVTRKPPPPTTRRPPAAGRARPEPVLRPRPPSTGVSRPAPPKLSKLPKLREDSFSGVTKPDALAPSDLDADEVTLQRDNPYALPPKSVPPTGATRVPSEKPGTTSYDSAAQPTVPGIPLSARRKLESQTFVDTAPPEGVQVERQAAQLYDELYDAVNTEVTRTEVLFGLTQFARRRLQSFTKRSREQRAAQLKRLDGCSARRARPLSATLTMYVSVLGLPIRLWLLTLLVLGSLAGMAVLVALDRAHGDLSSLPLPGRIAGSQSVVPSATAPTVAEPPVPSAAASSRVPERVLTLAERAASGDEQALRELGARPANERAAEDSVALDRGKIAKHLQALADMQEQFEKKPELLSDTEWLNTLRAFINYDRTSARALLVAARLPGSAGPDLLHRISTEPGVRASTAELARQLLYATDVRGKASKALAVALDLNELVEARDPERCDRVVAVLERALEVGDDRSLAPMGRLRKRSGCGPKQHDDCFPCLGGRALVAKAMRAARRKPQPESQ